MAKYWLFEHKIVKKVSLYLSFCHCNQGFLLMRRWFGKCQNCHSKQTVTVSDVTVSGQTYKAKDIHLLFDWVKLCLAIQ